MGRLRRVRIPFFRIWYSSTYTFLFIGCLILIAATPGDLIYQAIRNDQLQQVFAVGGSTLLTALLVILVYATRLYTNRTVLAAIPKSYLPIEKSEIGNSIHKLIVKAWNRSAIVAWDSRPRDLTEEALESRPTTAEHENDKTRVSSHIQRATIIAVSPEDPPWGKVAHNGWSSPSAADLPGLQYWSILVELPNLIEAKAVSLAPPDPAFEPSPEQIAAGLAPIPDERVVEFLRRPPGTDIRTYISRLSKLQLIRPPSLGVSFLRQYEFARFSTKSLSDRQFRDLMNVFGELLAGMSQLDPAALINLLEAEGDFDSETSSYLGSSAISSDVGSVRRHQPPGVSVEREDIGTVSRRATTSRQRTGRERMFSAVSHISDESISPSGADLLAGGPELGVEHADFVSVSSGQSLSSVIRRRPDT